MRRWACVLGLILCGAVLRAQPTAIQNDSLKWDYDDADLATGPVTLFLVCLDGQPTAACVQIPATGGVPTVPATTKTYTWKLPALTVGAHSVAVQACTAGASSCSVGATLAFSLQVITNPKNLRVGK